MSDDRKTSVGGANASICCLITARKTQRSKQTWLTILSLQLPAYLTEYICHFDVPVTSRESWLKFGKILKNLGFNSGKVDEDQIKFSCSRRTSLEKQLFQRSPLHYSSSLEVQGKLLEELLSENNSNSLDMT